jgi:hypothetical protein
MSPGPKTAKLKVGMLMIGPGPGDGLALAVWALTYGLLLVSKSGCRKFAPVPAGDGPFEPNCNVLGSALEGTT